MPPLTVTGGLVVGFGGARWSAWTAGRSLVLEVYVLSLHPSRRRACASCRPYRYEVVPPWGMPSLSDGRPHRAAPSGGVPLGRTPFPGPPAGGVPLKCISPCGAPAGGIPLGRRPPGGSPDGRVPFGSTPSAGGPPAGWVASATAVVVSPAAGADAWGATVPAVDVAVELSVQPAMQMQQQSRPAVVSSSRSLYDFRGSVVDLVFMLLFKGIVFSGRGNGGPSPVLHSSGISGSSPLLLIQLDSRFPMSISFCLSLTSSTGIVDL